jgi:nucleoside-diphosphate-sugar epimerase
VAERAPVAVVTGGAGFIGSRLSAALAQQGYDVRRVDVRPSPGVISGDVTTEAGWAAADGADVVVHTAALVGDAGSPGEFRRLNVDAVRLGLDAAERYSVGRFVHFSSKVVLGRDFPDGADESWPVQPTGNPYTDTKIASEHLCLARHAAGRVPVTVVRPGDVYGPGSAQWTLRPVELMKRGLFALPDGGRGVITATHVDDLVAGVVAVTRHPDAAGEIFHVTSGFGVSAAEFFRPYADALGVRLRLMPHGVGRVLAGVSSAAAAIRMPVPFSGRTFEYVTHPGTYSIDKIVTTTGWKPQIDLATGMAGTIAWLHTEGLLDR